MLDPEYWAQDRVVLLLLGLIAFLLLAHGWTRRQRQRVLMHRAEVRAAEAWREEVVGPPSTPPATPSAPPAQAAP